MNFVYVCVVGWRNVLAECHVLPLLGLLGIRKDRTDMANIMQPS